MGERNSKEQSEKENKMSVNTLGADKAKPQTEPVLLSSLLPPGSFGSRWAKNNRTFVASSVSSVAGTLGAFPLDSVKTRMQAYKYRNSLDCARQTYQSEGVRGFWRGCFAPLFSVAVVRTTSMTIYQKAKYKYSNAIGRMTGNDEPLVVVNRVGSTPTPATILCFGFAGATAGSMISVIACPFELTKMAAQISSLVAKDQKTAGAGAGEKSGPKARGGTFKMAQTIIQNRGYWGLYSGYKLHLARDTMGTFIYFSTYESTKQLLVKFQNSNSPTAPLAVAAAGGLCGVLSWAVTYPLDTAKARYQRDCLSQPKDTPLEKPKVKFLERNMYAGLGVSMARSCVLNMLFMSTFEFMKKQSNALPEDTGKPAS